MRPLLFLLTAAALHAGETKLFNGKDLTGWEGNDKLWSVEDGAITGRTEDSGDMKIKHNTFLVWKGGTVGDFELTFKYRIEKGNSGIQYRAKQLDPGAFGPILAGYQADLESGNNYSGILYEERGRGILAKRGEKVVIEAIEKDPNKKKAPSHKVNVTGSVGDSKEIQAAIKQGDWNDYKIVAKGNHLQHFINGKQTVDVTDNDPAGAKSGVLGIQIHQGPAMKVQFKDFVLKTED
ncbi:MAG: 3-keto-disaccharide hydrolase [Haloferula sp.]